MRKGQENTAIFHRMNIQGFGTKNASDVLVSKEAVTALRIALILGRRPDIN